MDTKAHPRETVVTLKPKHARNKTKLPCLLEADLSRAKLWPEVIGILPVKC